ncbi:MAG: phytoene/squalene synthase family protein [Pseudomonadota bacterium]
MPPRSLSRSESAAADIAACGETIRVGSRSFYAASLLLPAKVRDAALSLYAFCRVSDDLIDLGADQAEALERLHERLDRAYAGRPEDDPVDRAFAATVAAYEIPKALPRALLDGFAWDAAGHRFETIEDLQDYAARVAGSVGAMMSLVMGARSRAALSRACDLGVAMQLTNIARDVGEDARQGRIYLPLAWMRGAGVDIETWLASPHFDARVAGVVRRLLEEADIHYRNGLRGVRLLPRACRPSIRGAAMIYRDIGLEIRRNQFDSVRVRAVTPTWLKLARLARAVAGPVGSEGDLNAPPIRATRFLVDAAAAYEIEPARAGDAAPDAGPNILDLFIRLEKRDRGMRADWSVGGS